MSFFTFLKSKTVTKNVVSPSVQAKSKLTPSDSQRPVSTSLDLNRSQDEDFPDITLEEADMDQDLVNVAKRKHMRINRGQILDEDIKIYCRDLKTGRSSNGIILDISPGGLLMITKEKYVSGDDLLVSCRIGTNFRMKEQVKIRIVKGRKCGAEFISPSKTTTTFLTQLYGAVGLGRPRTRNKP